MLTVYSTYGSPGASTTAIYLAAQWASSGRQVLLIETDAAAGSLSQKLGIQFTPGTASFMAAGKPVTSADLIEHAQDVLFNDFHVMPTPSSPSGAKMVAEKFARLGEELRDISDGEMAIIVDGGRLTADARTSELTTSAAAVLIVSCDNTQLPSLEHLGGVLVDDASLPGPLGLVATVGPSPLKDAEWSSNHGLQFVGSVDLSTERGTDLSMFVSRGKRKSRKLRGSLEKLADALYEYACPASAAAPRVRLPANRPEADTAPADTPDATPAVDPDDLLAGVPPPAAPAPAPAPAPPLPPASALPPQQSPAYEQYGTGVPGAPPGQPPLQSPQYNQPPPAPAAHEPPPQQPDYPQQGYPEGGYADPGHAHGQPQPHPQQPLQPPGHVQPQYPAPPPGYAPAAYDHGVQGAPRYGQQEPVAYQPAQPAAEPPPVPPVEMPPPEAPTVPTGSFRSWAVQLFGESAGGDPDEKQPRPGTGATA
ncbi:tyrosine-protein kinase family protein [Candidatus Poriferisodalis sp.]|uniref:tyrosine-protein kinase family protein n=1 Tax=Candidatus Poriferisodalis sp. TaxID=3101277 RepID=UPI003B02B4C1